MNGALRICEVGNTWVCLDSSTNHLSQQLVVSFATFVMALDKMC
jgi:hypothetical protein